MIKQLVRVTIDCEDDPNEDGKRPGVIRYHRSDHVIRFDHIAFPAKERDVRTSQLMQDTWKPRTIKRAFYKYDKKREPESQLLPAIISLVLGTAILIVIYLLVVKW